MPVQRDQQLGSLKYGVWNSTETASGLLEALSDKEGYSLETVQSYASEERQQQWCAVRLLVQSLGFSETISYSDSGKPRLGKKKISISHSHHLVAVAIHPDKDIGIDIQLFTPKITRIYKKFMNAKELELTNTPPALKDACAIWSIKEAMYKLYGDCSPYFKADYEVISLNQEKAKCKMAYEQEILERTVSLEHFPDHLMALVTDA